MGNVLQVCPSFIQSLNGGRSWKHFTAAGFHRHWFAFSWWLDQTRCSVSWWGDSSRDLTPLTETWTLLTFSDASMVRHWVKQWCREKKKRKKVTRIEPQLSFKWGTDPAGAFLFPFMHRAQRWHIWRLRSLKQHHVIVNCTRISSFILNNTWQEVLPYSTFT